MTLSKVVAAAVIATMAFTYVAAPALADTKKKDTTDNRRIVANSRTSARITVRPRSFLDPGTETLQFNVHSADYAFPPLYTPIRSWAASSASGGRPCRIRSNCPNLGGVTGTEGG
jgi:hypothetical protein